MHAQQCPTLSDPVYYRPSGSSIHGIFQAGILEWVAISSSRESSLIQGSNLRLLFFLHWQADSLPLSHLGNSLKKQQRYKYMDTKGERGGWEELGNWD